MIIKLLLWISFSLFILHEMDAVRTSEWKMLIFLNRLADNKADIVFTSLHFFLFIILFYLMDHYFYYLFPVFSVLLIIHWAVHLVFRKHSANRMNNVFSQILIYLMFINSCVSLLYYFISL